ncbi:AmmeMemoRadiSam system protein B [Pontiella agarivorans]|uniref:AmmeMemoRadiSam system protein B n=1 Tax=Pontiella agarivorans TaxID=3038953 RepID=A0ABU5MZF9_9BACT|nr:AmmeMemoRadiSam system protein B [Pontiella agarivorans]MDZ8119351.1 AmmeMemoRadiSam system protein B [Pontiella agarivorans]
MKTTVLDSGLAGQWYSDDPVHLAHVIDAYLDAADPPAVENPIGLLLPHAGYRYSGMAAAYGAKLLKNSRFKRVIIIGPSHRVVLQDSVSIPEVTHIKTPLGLIPLDGPAISELRKNDVFLAHPQAHRNEHSVQIELPILQRVLNGFSLIPVVCGQLSEAGAKRIAAELKPLMNDETLLVISSDFTHYGQSFGYVPFTQNIEENLRALDMGAFAKIQAHDLQGFQQYVQDTGATICGSGPIAVLLAMLPEDAKIDLLKYETSGNLTGDWSHCVSYLSAAVSGHWKTDAAQGKYPELSSKDKHTLLAFARYIISKELRPDIPAVEIQPTPVMQEKRGVFVTLHKRGQLRGCIGEIFPRRPLIDAVNAQALNAAFHDPRFPKLRADELAEVDLEISVLTPPEPVDSWEHIEIGRHGIVLSCGPHSAVFLPQVATEQGWDLETTLTHLSVKAGRPSNAWKADCAFEVFEADVFGE